MRRLVILIWTAVPTAAPLIVGVFMQAFTIAAQADVTDGLVAHYAFEGNVLDGGSNGNHGTGFGDIDFVSGAFGQAASFDGLDDYVQTPRSIAGDFSVAFWLGTTRQFAADKKRQAKKRLARVVWLFQMNEIRNSDFQLNSAWPTSA